MAVLASTVLVHLRLLLVYHGAKQTFEHPDFSLYNGREEFLFFPLPLLPPPLLVLLSLKEGINTKSPLLSIYMG